MKNCNKCGKLKDMNDFSKHKEMADGYLSTCKECKRQYLNELRKSKKNKEYDEEQKKECFKCGFVGNAIEHFHAKVGGKYNRDEWCKTCRLEYNRNRTAFVPENMPESKVCSKCNQTKLISEFSPEKTGKFGLRSECKKCNSQRVQNYVRGNRNNETM